MSLMLLQCLAEDEDVVEEHQHEVVQVLAEGLMHQVHEGAWCIGEPEWQHQEFEVPITCAERGFRYIRRIDADLMVAAPQIELAEVLGSLQSIEQFIHQRKRVT